MRDYSITVAVKSGTLFNVTCTLNGYLVLPSQEADPNSWHGKIPDKKIPLVIAAVGVAGSNYELKCKIGNDDNKSEIRNLPEGGADVYHHEPI